MCEAVTERWVVWGAAFVEDVFYFCDNDCLVHWIKRGIDDMCRDIRYEHRAILEDEAAHA